MLISYILNRHSRTSLDAATSAERKSLHFKRIFLSVNIISFWLAGYFFLRHNWYCEAGGRREFFFFIIHFISKN